MGNMRQIWELFFRDRVAMQLQQSELCSISPSMLLQAKYRNHE